MAFVVIQHLDPARPSMLTSVLGQDTRMPVVEVTEGMRAEPNRVHVIPPGADLTIHEGVLSLVPRLPTHKLHLPIDSFLRALAIDSPGRAVGVILSGSASDGTEGLRAIKAAGGIAIVQEPDSAQFQGMPESAIAAGVADFRSTPEGIALELARLSHEPYLALPEVVDPQAAVPAGIDEEALATVLDGVRQHASLDFTGYKRPTILRRVARRMALRRIGSLKQYAELLRHAPGEAKALAEDVLIHVTSFFRDPVVFAAVSEQVLPRLLARRDKDTPLRIWVPGVSTGEEAYSLAICLLEFLSRQHRTLPIKIFASDLSDRAIETARAGVYAESDLDGVSPERLARFFERADGGYRIVKQVRDLCVFVRHDLTRDPPFVKLDLISCRNVLIYFDVELQRRILPLLHHCLNKAGYLLLGSSEGIREFDDLFASIDKESRIFLKTGESPRVDYPLAFGREAESRLPVFHSTRRHAPARDAQRQADHILLARYAPPGVVVDERFEVVQFRGHTGAFIGAPPGQPQTNVLKIVRGGLSGALGEALESAKSQSVSVRREAVHFSEGELSRQVSFEVIPLTDGVVRAEQYFLIVFEDDVVRHAEAPPLVASMLGDQLAARPAPDGEVARLRGELAATRDYLQALKGEHADTAEELGAANEELISANEEQQSTNEELQSAKEELQSTNEELTTLNDELNSRNLQLDRIADDLVNVLESVQIPVIMVGHALHVRRFTPTAREVSSFLPTDVGRSIDDVKLSVKVDNLADKIRDTIDSVSAKEYEVQGGDGRWFRLHIRPYRTIDSRLDGAVLSFLDIDRLKRAVREAESARDYAQRLVETVPVPLVVLDEGLHIVAANPSFVRSFVSRGTPLERTALLELARGAFDVPALRGAIERSLASGLVFEEIDVECTFPGDAPLTKALVCAGCPIRGATGDSMLLLAIEDVTERRQLEEKEKLARVEAERANRAKDLFLVLTPPLSDRSEADFAHAA